MTMDSTKPAACSTEEEHFLCDDWFDPLENGVRIRIRGFIEELLEAELDAALGRARYERGRLDGEGSPKGAVGSRHGHRERSLMGTFGTTTVRVPRARLATPEGKTSVSGASIRVSLEGFRLFAALESDGHPELADSLDAGGNLAPGFVLRRRKGVLEGGVENWPASFLGAVEQDWAKMTVLRRA
jgi:hypothetical protein